MNKIVTFHLQKYLFLYKLTVLSCDTVARKAPSGLHLMPTTYLV